MILSPLGGIVNFCQNNIKLVEIAVSQVEIAAIANMQFKDSILHRFILDCEYNWVLLVWLKEFHLQ